jgi:hypothetical protein
MNTVIINGQKIEDITVQRCSANMMVSGDIKADKLDVQGNIRCQDITGDVSSVGNVTCGNISGSVSCVGNIRRN